MTRSNNNLIIEQWVVFQVNLKDSNSSRNLQYPMGRKWIQFILSMGFQHLQIVLPKESNLKIKSMLLQLVFCQQRRNNIHQISLKFPSNQTIKMIHFRRYLMNLLRNSLKLKMTLRYNKIFKAKEVNYPVRIPLAHRCHNKIQIWITLTNMK